MGILIVAVIILLSIIYHFEQRKERKHYVSSMLLCFFIFVVVAGNRFNADYEVYRITYENISLNLSFGLLANWAYYSLIFFCRFLRLSYEHYRLVAFLIGFYIIWISYNRVSKENYIAFLVYMIYPMMMDCTQMKNFLAMSFLLFGVTMLVTDEKKGKFKFLIALFISSGFHVTSLIYIPLLFLYDNSYRNRTKIISILPVIGFAVVFSNRRMSGFLSKSFLSISGDLVNRSNDYLGSSVNNGYLVFFLATFISIALIYLLKKEVESRIDATGNEIRLAKIGFICTIYSLVFFPFYFQNREFSRFFRNFIVIYSLLFSVANKRESAFLRNHQILQFSRCIRTRKTIINLGYLSLLVYMFYFDIYHNPLVFDAFLDYNII